MHTFVVIKYFVSWTCNMQLVDQITVTLLHETRQQQDDRQ